MATGPQLVTPTAPAAASGPAGQSSTRLGWSSLLVVLGVSAALSLLLGQDANGDQRLAHVPAVWLALHPGLDPLLSPGSYSGLFPSTWNIPWFLLTQHAPAWVAVVYLGVLHGVAVWLSAAITWTLLRATSRGLRLGLTCLATLFAFIAPATLAEFGTTFGDIATAVPIQAALLVYLRRPEHEPVARGRALLVGLLVGTAFGLKFTNVTAVVALVVAVAAVEVRYRNLVRSGAALALGTALGTLAGAGWWGWLMWDRFGNPLFPLYNGIFRSPFLPAVNPHDPHFMDLSWLERLSMPLRMLSLETYPSEWWGRDARWFLLALLAAAVVAHRLVLRRRDRGAARPGIVSSDHRRLVLVYVATGWVVWLALFDIARYLVAFELLSGALLVLLVDFFPLPKVRVLLAVAMACIITAAAVAVPGWTRRDNQGDWFAFSPNSLVEQPDLLVVYPGTGMLNFTVIALPPDAVSVRVPAAFGDPRSDWPSPWQGDREITDLVAEHDGPVVSVSWRSQFRLVTRNATRYGFAVDRKECRPWRNKFDTALVCPWVRRR